MTCSLLADEPSSLAKPASLESFFAEPANWQGAPGTMPAPPATDDTIVRPSPLIDSPSGEVATPLLDDGSCLDQQPPVVGEHVENGDRSQRRGVRPYGGGHPDDWPWGCGGSPYRTGPGMCDNYRVGPIWNVAVDGMVMRREGTNLAQIWNETDDGQAIPELLEQFDYAPGGRVSLVGKYPWCAGYQVQAAYEGIEAWEAVVIYPKQELNDIFIFPDTVDPDIEDVQLLGASAQRRVHYRSNLHSGELNILKCHNNVWQPFCGVRYIKFDDELRIFDDQEAQGPLAVLNPPDDSPIEIITTDMTNLFDLENNLMGFQVGLRRDFWRVNSRFAIEGFINGGVYYNKIKYNNLMNTTTTQRIGTVTSIDTQDTINFTGDANVVSATNMDASDLSEIAYSGEASLSAVCRINKCWAMRAGYQVLWINGLRLADDAFLDPDTFLGNESRSMIFQGWHAGIECRR
jgi:hypothetical protein